MHIIWLEMKKALRSPVIISLLILFIGFNVFTIINEADLKDELKVVNTIVEKYGLVFNDTILREMQQDLNSDVQKVDVQFDTAEKFLEAMTYEKYEAETVEGQKEIDRIRLMQMYIALGESLDERYAGLNIETLKQGMINDFQLTGSAENIISAEYDKLVLRLEEMKATSEYKEWFFAGDYRMHSELFRRLMKNMAIQGVMIVVLLTALIVNYEFEHRTQLVVYATKKGRSLMKNKLLASLLSALLVLLPLFGVSILTFFTIYDYSGLWRTHISSGLNWEYNWPYITWWPVEFWQYLILSITILVSTLLLISVLTFVIGSVIKNSYVTWIICILLLVCLFIVPSFTGGTLLLLMNLNLVLLLLNPHMYFNGVSGLTMIEHHEFWTLALWFVISVFCMVFAFKRFYRKDIV